MELILNLSHHWPRPALIVSHGVINFSEFFNDAVPIRKLPVRAMPAVQGFLTPYQIARDMAQKKSHVLEKFKPALVI